MDKHGRSVFVVRSNDMSVYSGMFVKFPVGWEHPKTVPMQALRDVQERARTTGVLSDEDKPLVDACIAYVCNEAPRFSQP